MGSNGVSDRDVGVEMTRNGAAGRPETEVFRGSDNAL